MAERRVTEVRPLPPGGDVTRRVMLWLAVRLAPDTWLTATHLYTPLSATFRLRSITLPDGRRSTPSPETVLEIHRLLLVFFLLGIF